ncbi:hypothetical protein HYX02_06740 [Candidatus Woesearchaeota archaeon]|nr:hypothetical protein [Candidatus Woesearchaeota archaeon]
MAKKSLKNVDDKNYFMVCPRCGSTNVYHDLSKDMMAWGAPTRWLCKNCDYSAIVFPKLHKSKIEDFKKKIQQRTKEQQEIINKPTITKGYVNRKFNAILLFIYVISIVFGLIILIYDVITNQNYALFVFILLLILAISIGVFLNKLIKDF